LRDQDRLPRLDATVLDDELKLLADTRDQLIVAAGRWRNRAHALLRVASPGYQSKTGAPASAGSVRRARTIAKRSIAEGPGPRPPGSAGARRSPRSSATRKLEREIRELLRIRGCTHVLAIRGVCPIVAATILGETRGIGRFRSPAAFAAHTGSAPVPASSGRTQRHRLNRAATASSTALSTPSSWSRPAGTRSTRLLGRKLAEGQSASEARRCLPMPMPPTRVCAPPRPRRR
jgi:transposase